MKKIFGNIKMSWIATILFAVITGIYTGAVMLVPVLDNTSFQDIGIAYEWWVVFAVIIVVNCKKNWEAALKCLVFFIISQPLVYLIEILFGNLTFEFAKSYYFSTWLPLTAATLPGGFAAFYCKKQSPLGAVILGLGNTIEMVMLASYIMQTAQDFPHHVLSAVFCVAAIVVMTLCIQKENKNRVIAFLTPVILGIILGIAAKATGRLNF